MEPHPRQSLAGEIILKLGAKPLESLAIALCSHEHLGKGQYTADLIEKFKQHGPQLHWLCRQALHGQPETRRVVILVDQFEEVFSLCGDEDERKAFIDNLLTAATDATGQTIVLLTMRADFYGKCGLYLQLAAALSGDQCLLGPMTPNELREAIVAPAQRFGCEVEPGLVEKLLSDVANQPGSLPLLEHALEGTSASRENCGSKITRDWKKRWKNGPTRITTASPPHRRRFASGFSCA